MAGTKRKNEGTKEKTDSNRKSSLRSSSKSTSKSFQTKNKETEELETFKTIYKASDDKVKRDPDAANLTLSIITWFQGTIPIYLISAIIYQLIWGEDNDLWFVLMEILIFELFAVVQLLLLSKRVYTGTTCFFLSIQTRPYSYTRGHGDGKNCVTLHTPALSIENPLPPRVEIRALSIQFFLLFTLFSLFLHSTYDSNSALLQRAFGLSAVCLLSSGLHFFIVTQSIQLIKVSRQRNDYSEKVIVEGVEKKRMDLYLMISDLISEICYDDKDLKVNLIVKDETGRPKSMRGAGVEAGVSRVLEMSTDGQNVNLSTSNTTLACINVPKHHHHHHHSKNQHSKNSLIAPMIDSKYNNCEKQEKMLSPRTILK